MGIERGLIYFYGYLAYYLGGWGLGSILFSFKFYMVNFENIRIQYEVISNKIELYLFHCVVAKIMLYMTFYGQFFTDDQI